MIQEELRKVSSSLSILKRIVEEIDKGDEKNLPSLKFDLLRSSNDLERLIEEFND